MKALELNRMDEEVVYDALTMYVNSLSDQCNDPDMLADSAADRMAHLKEMERIARNIRHRVVVL